MQPSLCDRCHSLLMKWGHKLNWKILIWLKKVEHCKTKYQEQFLGCKCTSICNLNEKKVEKYELKKFRRLKLYIKMERIIIKFGDVEIKKQ